MSKGEEDEHAASVARRLAFYGSVANSAGTAVDWAESAFSDGELDMFEEPL